jgi:hypothetical protein
LAKTKRKVSDLTVEDLKSVIHEVTAEDMEAWRETLEIMADRKLLKLIREADADWSSGGKEAYVSWDDLKNAYDYSPQDRR